MNYKDALEMWQIFTVAAQEAKRKNIVEPEYNITVEELVSYFKKAFPNKNNEERYKKIAKKILESEE